MKTQSRHFSHRPGASKRHEQGMVSVVFIALLSIMLILVMAESKALFQLHREVKLLEHKQIQRLNPSPGTNVVAATTLESK